ncbi:5'-3' exonuclease [Mycoplasmopsis agassizii]|nr:5'-3' exonuclease [Mycoplasmopsis agassizii]
MNNQHKRILLIDGSYLAFRSFYAAQSAKYITSTEHFFFMSLLSLIKSISPTHLYIATDVPGKTWRHEAYEGYKATRSETPEQFREDLKSIFNLLKAANFAFGGKTNHEADDVIATLAQHKSDNDLVYIFSKDHDLLQLVEKNIFVTHDTKLEKMYTIDNFLDEYGVLPSQIPDLKGLAGDSSDNLKGVPGIGKKTAAKLLTEFNNLENLYEKLADSTVSEKQKEKLFENKELVFQCKKLATLTKDLDLGLNDEDYRLKVNFDQQARETFAEKKLNTVSRELEELYESDNW